MHLAYCFLNKMTKTMIENMFKFSNKTIISVFAKFHDLLFPSVYITVKISGKYIVVEICESKFGKVKYWRGHRVDCALVVGLVEKTPERRLFMVVIDDKTAPSLKKIILDHVKSGCIIHTYCCKGYSNVGNLGFTHKKVNNYLLYRNPVTGVNTNSIVGTLSAVKRTTPVRNRTRHDMENWLIKFIWKRYNRENLWLSFLEAIYEGTFE